MMKKKLLLLATALLPWCGTLLNATPCSLVLPLHCDSQTPKTVTPTLKMQTNAPKGTSLFFRVVGTSPITITSSNGYQKVVTPSTTLEKMTGLQIITGEPHQAFTFSGNLVALDCKNAQLTLLDCSKATDLQFLDASNNGLTHLNVTACPQLRFLYLMQNQLKNVMLGALPQLESLNLSFNQLEFVSLAQLTGLKNLSVDHNKISRLKLDTNTALEKLYCKHNKLTTLSVDMLPRLTELSAESNQLAQVDLSKNPALKTVALKDNLLTAIDLSHNPLLTEINVNSNALKALEVSHCPDLTELYCNTNQLTTLDVSQNTALEVLSCGDNALTTLDVSNHRALSSLAVMYNRLTDLRLSHCAALVGVGADHNQLSALDFSGCRLLRMADVSFNAFTVPAAVSMVASLPTTGGEAADDMGVLIYMNRADFPEDTEHNVYAAAIAQAAKAKNWIVADGETILSVQKVVAAAPFQIVSNPMQTVFSWERRAASAAVYSLDGKLVKRVTNAVQIDLSTCPQGVYVLRVVCDGQVRVQKIEVKGMA